MLGLTGGLALVAGLAWGAAVKEGYVTRCQTSPTNTCEVFFPQNPTKAIRLVSWDVLTDTNNTALWMLSGTMPLTITGIANTTNLITASNAFVGTNAVAIIQRADDTIFSVSILGTNNYTNVIISATNSIPIATNDVLWICTNVATAAIQSPTQLANTNGVRAAGECLFMAGRRAPLVLRITNGLNNATRISATVRYDDNAP